VAYSSLLKIGCLGINIFIEDAHCSLPMIVYCEEVGQTSKDQSEGSQKASVMLAVADFQNQLLDLHCVGDSARGFCDARGGDGTRSK
jgi:hypothetical protein